MVESTTMGAMSPEPAPLADALSPWMEKLKARGLTEEDILAADVAAKETDAEKAARRQARLATYALRWQEKVPVMYREASVEALDDNQHAATVRFWLTSGALHLVLAGSVGTGKTYAAYAVGNQALARGMWVEAWSVGDLLDALRPGSGDPGAEDRARKCHLLILDDLPAKATDWEAERLTLLLDARVRAQLQTVPTTNVTQAQITDVWGGRFMDRLRYRMTALTFKGESRRGGDW